MKILFFQFPLRPALGGAETHTLALARGLSTAGWEIIVLSSNRRLVEALKRERIFSRYLWCGWEPTSIGGLLLFPMTCLVGFPIFFCALLFFRPQRIICLSLTDKLLATPLTRLFGCKAIWIEHTRLDRWLFISPLRPVFVLVSRLATVTAPSFFSRNQLLQNGLSLKNMKVIYPGTPSAYTAQQKSKAPTAVAFLGRLSAEKGVDTLIRAWKLLAASPTGKKFPDWKLVIAGEGEEEKPLKKLVKALGLSEKVDFWGAVGDKADFFSKIGYLAVPSRKAESFGMVIIEAMAAGVPVIASRIGAIPEIIEHEKTGLLFPPGEEKALADTLARGLIDNWLRESLILAAHQAVGSRFELARMIEDFKRLLL